MYLNPLLNVEIRNLTECYNYTFSVEALSEHLSGMSNNSYFELGIVSMIQEYASFELLYCLEVLYISLPMTGTSELPVNVTGEAVSSTVISVTWDHLRACRAGSHLSANNSVLNAIVEYTTVHQTKELFTATSEAFNWTQSIC